MALLHFQINWLWSRNRETGAIHPSRMMVQMTWWLSGMPRWVILLARQTTNESLPSLNFWQAGGKLATEDDFERKHHSFY